MIQGYGVKPVLHEDRLVAYVVLDCLGPLAGSKDGAEGHKGEQQALLASFGDQPCQVPQQQQRRDKEERHCLWFAITCSLHLMTYTIRTFGFSTVC